MYGDDDNAGGDNKKATFQIKSTKLYVPIVTLSTKDNVNLTKQSNEGFKRSVYWNEYKSKIETKRADNDNIPIFPLDASFQGANRLFVLAFNNITGNDDNNPINNTANRVQRDSHRRYFLPYRTGVISCNCTNSKNLNHHHGYILTRDLQIIENERLRKIISKGPNFREPKTINWKTSKESIVGGRLRQSD